MRTTTRACLHALLVGTLIGSVGCSPMTVATHERAPDAPAVTFAAINAGCAEMAPSYCVTLTDHTGKTVWTDSTNLVTPLRIDPLPPGDYTLAVAGYKQSIRVRADRTLEVTYDPYKPDPADQISFVVSMPFMIALVIAVSPLILIMGVTGQLPRC